MCTQNAHALSLLCRGRDRKGAGGVREICGFPEWSGSGTLDSPVPAVCKTDGSRPMLIFFSFF